MKTAQRNYLAKRFTQETEKLRCKESNDLSCRLNAGRRAKIEALPLVHITRRLNDLMTGKHVHANGVTSTVVYFHNKVHTLGNIYTAEELAHLAKLTSEEADINGAVAKLNTRYATETQRIIDRIMLDDSPQLDKLMEDFKAAVRKHA